MNKKHYLIFIMLCFSVCLFAEGNPNWPKGVPYTKKDGISPYLWAPKSVEIAGEMNFFCYDYTRNSIFDYSLYATANLSKMFNFQLGFASRNFEKYPDTFAIALHSHPTNFFSFQFDYRARIFPEYHTANNALVTLIEFYADVTKWVDFHVKAGGSMTFKDINTADNGTTFHKDWFLFLNFLYQFRVFVHPLPWFSFGTVFGNYSDFEVNSFDFWQCDTVCEFYPTPSRDLTLIVKFSVISGGALNFGSIIDRLALTFGGRYAIKL